MWHDESCVGTGGCHAATGRRPGDGLARAARDARAVGSSPFYTAADCLARPHHPAGRRRCGCAPQCSGTRYMAQDSAILALALAGSGGRAAGSRTVGGCAAPGSAGDLYGRTNLRVDRHDMREAIGKRAAHQPLEPTRDCRRSHATGPHAEDLAALGGAFFKKESDLKPHCIRYWLTPKPDPDFDAKCADICAVYKTAANADDTHRTVSIDEMTGIQALERIAPNLPMKPGKVERREFEYRRHGTQTLIAAFDVTTGKIEGTIGNTRTEKDFARFKSEERRVGKEGR